MALAESGVASPFCVAPDHGGAAPTRFAWRDGCAGCGTLIGWLHPGQVTVFPNAFSVTSESLQVWTTDLERHWLTPEFISTARRIV